MVESVSPASNPRETWSYDEQRAKNAERVGKGLAPYDDRWVAHPSAVYPCILPQESSKISSKGNNKA